MKIVLFGHTPPPHHGQSFLVQQLLDVFGGDAATRKPQPAVGTGQAEHSADEIAWFHVNSRLSDGVHDIGRPRPGKLVRLVGYCLLAIWYRFRFGASTLFYQPAPGALTPLVRDWLVMALCRPFFGRLILFWPGAGLGEWLETSARPWQRWLTVRLLGRADLSIVKSQYGRHDAEVVGSRRITVVPNGIPDPVPDFDARILPRRRQRALAWKQLLEGRSSDGTGGDDTGSDPSAGDPRLFRVLYIGHCIPEKGFFDTIDGVAEVNRRLAEQRSTVRVRLTAAGEFWNDADRQRFAASARAPEFSWTPAERTVGDRERPPTEADEPIPLIEHVGFVSGDRKWQLFTESDCFCFPTYYPPESFGIVQIESMAFDLPIVASRWRMIPEILTPDYPGLVQWQCPAEIADVLWRFLTTPPELSLRARFLEEYLVDRWRDRIHTALMSVAAEPPDA